jgi:hypothetical protein
MSFVTPKAKVAIGELEFRSRIYTFSSGILAEH